MYLAIDLGTTGLKAIVIDETQRLRAAAERAQTAIAGAPGQAEQHPDDWIRMARSAIAELISTCPELTRDLRMIGLSGQMHSLVALDAQDRPLRPAMLWNDSRGQDFLDAARALPEISAITGVSPNSSFTAAKLHWLRAHEPAHFARIRRILWPKDHLRLWLTGDWATDPSDAGGSQLYDQQTRQWSEPVLRLLDLPAAVMPPVVASDQPAGRLRAALARELGLPQVPVVTGAADAAAGGLAAGNRRAGEAMISLGTGALILVPDGQFQRPEAPGLHVFAHCLPDMWYRMTTMLAAGSALDWTAHLLGTTTPAALAAIEARGWHGPGRVTALPHLDGRRGDARSLAQCGALTGLQRATGPLDVIQAMMEGICQSLALGWQVLAASGALHDRPLVMGGPSRSPLMARMLASALGQELRLAEDAATGSALGAARLAMLADGHAMDQVAIAPPTRIASPDAAASDAMAAARADWARMEDWL